MERDRANPNRRHQHTGSGITAAKPNERSGGDEGRRGGGVDRLAPP